MFDGKVKSVRQVSFAGKNARSDAKSAKDLVENARKQREARAQDRQRSTAATKIQKIVRRTQSQKHLRKTLRSSFDLYLNGESLVPSNLHNVLQFCPWFFEASIDQSRLHTVNRIVLEALSGHERIVLENLGCDLTSLTQPHNVIRCLARTISLSIETAVTLLRKTGSAASSENEIISLVDVVRAVDLSQTVLRENQLLGVVLSLYLARPVSAGLRDLAVTDDRSNHNTAAQLLRGALQRVLIQGLRYRDEEYAVIQLSDGVREAIRRLRQVSPKIPR